MLTELICVWLSFYFLSCRSLYCSLALWEWTWIPLTSTMMKRCGKHFNIPTLTSLWATVQQSWSWSVQRGERTSGRHSYQRFRVDNNNIYNHSNNNNNNNNDNNNQSYPKLAGCVWTLIMSSVLARGSWCVWLELSSGKPGSWSWMKLQLLLTWRRMTLSSPPFALSLKTARFSPLLTGSIQSWTTQG